MRLPRFYPILDSGLCARRGIVVSAAARAFLEGGSQILQFRQKGPVTRDSLAELEEVAKLCREFAVPLVVNDRADLALMVGAALHLGQDDLPPSAARRIVGTEVSIGFSTHNEAQLRAAEQEPVDYLALGPVFGTTSKENPDPVVGVEPLRLLRPLTARPLVAIGGITRTTARDVLAAGADSVAIIGDLLPEGIPPGLSSLEARIKEWLFLLKSG